MEEGNPRSNEGSKIADLTQEEILHLLDAATDFKIRRETETDASGEETDVYAEGSVREEAAQGGSARDNTPEARTQADGDEACVSDTVRILADLLTIQEHFGYLREIAFGCPREAAQNSPVEAWQAVCEKMGMEWLAEDALPALPEEAQKDGVTAIAMETDADEQQIVLYEMPASHPTVQAVMYALTRAEAGEEATDET